MTTPGNDLTVRTLKFAILRALAGTRHQHKFNLLGKGSDQGDLERQLGIRFERAERHLADIAFRELETAELIRPTYDDLISPGLWVEITDAGRHALERQALDPLDEALHRISPNLVELRAGAWAAVTSARTDSLRQASHSARELIDQALKEGAPDEAVRRMPGFSEDKDSRSGLTRRHRLRYLMNGYSGAVSESRLRVAEEACDLVLATNDRLKAMAHARETPSQADVQDSLRAAEIALRTLLVPNDK